MMYTYIVTRRERQEHCGEVMISVEVQADWFELDRNDYGVALLFLIEDARTSDERIVAAFNTDEWCYVKRT